MFQTNKRMNLIFSHTFESPKEKGNTDIQLAMEQVVLQKSGSRPPGY